MARPYDKRLYFAFSETICIMSYVSLLEGGGWSQYSNHASQVYYMNLETQESQYAIPAGWEDHPGDTWNYDSTYMHWVNARTGRVIFIDPNPPPPQLYTEDRHIATHIRTLDRHLDSSEALYRRATTGILRFLFRGEGGYDVIQEDSRDTSAPDHTVFKVECRAGGSTYMYDFLMVECKKADYNWEAAVEHLTRHCENGHNESGQVYGMIQVGMNVQFFHWGNTTLTTMSGVFHLRNDPEEITQWAEYLKANPFPFV
ncbi:hypothetical protein C2857_007894 [Epichloe festucae Fl1]|uniref:WW domain-containing protein n=1 Tax=Epichloe festucae (strain Fl1) TaxID=877507 RepID=A0A7S9KR49_EPIFF|nr:hypothetical protein C2857_007894 [Epichloe festucae Fl1]